jgi:hypothetical protein
MLERKRILRPVESTDPRLLVYEQRHRRVDHRRKSRAADGAAFSDPNEVYEMLARSLRA